MSCLGTGWLVYYLACTMYSILSMVNYHQCTMDSDLWFYIYDLLLTPQVKIYYIQVGAALLCIDGSIVTGNLHIVSIGSKLYGIYGIYFIHINSIYFIYGIQNYDFHDIL